MTNVLRSRWQERASSNHNADKIKRIPEAQKYEVLLQIVKAANSKLSPGTVTASIMNNIQKLIPCDAWSILLFSKDKNELIFQSARGEGAEKLSSARLKLGEGIAGWVAETRKAAIVNDVSMDNRFNSDFDRRTQFRTKSILCAPLLSRNELLGVVELINRKSKNQTFLKQDLNTLVTLLGPIAASLHNALLYQEAQALAITDDLTKLHNNRFINRCLTGMIQRSKKNEKKFSVVFLDLDGFKSVNDRYGHLIGGQTLVEIGRLIQKTIRKKDHVARYGGDEFIVILPHTGGEEALVVAEKIRRAILNHDFSIALHREIRLSASFGIAVYPDHADTLTELIQKADNAMYQVKYSGKNSVQLAQ